MRSLEIKMKNLKLKKRPSPAEAQGTPQTSKASVPGELESEF